jgi:hypothetical protein
MRNRSLFDRKCDGWLYLAKLYEEQDDGSDWSNKFYTAERKIFK